MIEHIYAPAHIDGGEGLIAIVIHAPNDKEITPPGIQFITTPTQPLQLGLINYGPNQTVAPHVHLSQMRMIEQTQEVLFVRRGVISITLYTGIGEEIKCITLTKGSVIMLCGGGHSVLSYDNAEIVEVKNGPYYGRDKDKIEFSV